MMLLKAVAGSLARRAMILGIVALTAGGALQAGQRGNGIAAQLHREIVAGIDQIGRTLRMSL